MKNSPFQTDNKVKKTHFNKTKTCYLCQTGRPEKFFRKLGYQVYKCPSCGLLSLDLGKNYQEFIADYYQKGYFTGDQEIRAYINYEEDQTNVFQNARKILNKIKNFKKSGNLLDIGCAMGFFMEEAEKEGFSAFGIEVSEYAGKIASSKFKKRVFIGSIENFLSKKLKPKVFPNTKFDVVVMSDVIEHLEDPQKILEQLRLFLNKGALLVIQTGDADSLWAKITGKNWHFFAPPQHLYFFSQKTLGRLLNAAGYETLKIYKQGKNVSLRYLTYMLPYMNIDLTGNRIYRFLTGSFLGQISFPVKLFDNMVVIAKSD